MNAWSCRKTKQWMNEIGYKDTVYGKEWLVPSNTTKYDVIYLFIDNNCFGLYGHLQVNIWILKTSMSTDVKNIKSLDKLVFKIHILTWRWPYKPKQLLSINKYITSYLVVLDGTNHSLPYCYQHNGMDSNEYNTPCMWVKGEEKSLQAMEIQYGIRIYYI
jgi:hypothetical protein